MRALLTLPAFVVAAAAGCGGGSSDPDAPPGATPDAEVDAAGPARERIGWVDVYEERAIYDDGGGPIETRGAQVRGEFYGDHPPRWHRQTMAAGACTLREYLPALCDPACTDGLCVGDPPACETWPTLVSAGELEITGLTTPVSITPQSGYYYPQDALPEELFADTAAIIATLAGDVIPAVALDTGGVPALQPQITDKITLTPGEDHVVTWTPVGVGRVRLTLNSNNSGHGAPFHAIIECEVDDTAGAITIPAALIDAFPETYAWRICAGSDCPPSHLRRYRSDAAPVGGDQEIQLTVASQFTFGVDHILPD